MEDFFFMYALAADDEIVLLSPAQNAKRNERNIKPPAIRCKCRFVNGQIEVHLTGKILMMDFREDGD